MSIMSSVVRCCVSYLYCTIYKYYNLARFSKIAEARNICLLGAHNYWHEFFHHIITDQDLESRHNCFQDVGVWQLMRWSVNLIPYSEGEYQFLYRHATAPQDEIPTLKEVSCWTCVIEELS